MVVQKVNDAEFKAVLESHDRVVVKYYADWCGNCRLFAPKFNRMAEDEKNAAIAFLDINAEQSPEARKLAGVSNLPFFAVFQNGKLVKGDFTSKQESVEAMIELIRG
jgi:thiol-disulfide isomerase/thioredoxin